MKYNIQHECSGTSFVPVSYRSDRTLVYEMSSAPKQEIVVKGKRKTAPRAVLTLETSWGSNENCLSRSEFPRHAVYTHCSSGRVHSTVNTHNFAQMAPFPCATRTYSVLLVSSIRFHPAENPRAVQ